MTQEEVRFIASLHAIGIEQGFKIAEAFFKLPESKFLPAPKQQLILSKKEENLLDTIGEHFMPKKKGGRQIDPNSVRQQCIREVNLLLAKGPTPLQVIRDHCSKHLSNPKHVDVDAILSSLPGIKREYGKWSLK